jgi:hypothetical protein
MPCPALAACRRFTPVANGTVDRRPYRSRTRPPRERYRRRATPVSDPPLRRSSGARTLLARHADRQAGDLLLGHVAERFGTEVGIPEPGLPACCFCLVRSGRVALSTPDARGVIEAGPGGGVIHHGRAGTRALSADGTARANVRIAAGRFEAALGACLGERVRHDAQLRHVVHGARVEVDPQPEAVGERLDDDGQRGRGPGRRVQQTGGGLALLADRRGPLPVVAFRDRGEHRPRGGLAPERVPQGQLAPIADRGVEVGADQGDDAVDGVGTRGLERAPPHRSVLLVVPAQRLGKQRLLGLEVEDRDPLRQAGLLRHGRQGGARQAVLHDRFDRGLDDLAAPAGGVVGALPPRPGSPRRDRRQGLNSLP